MTDGYPIPACFAEREHVVRKSRFIARAHPVSDRVEALGRVEEARSDYPDARHHCWAYLIGDPGSASTAATEDDGEPGGTAGKPILNVIQHKGIGDVLVVVIRYFGGVKLGAGGLTRAYAQATERVLAELPLERHEHRLNATVSLDFSQEQALRHWAASRRAEFVGIRYGDGVEIDLHLPLAVRDTFREFCAAHSITIRNENQAS